MSSVNCLDKDTDKIWDRLTDKEKIEFKRMVEDGELGSEVSVWSPWWTSQVRPKKINYMFLRHRPRHLQPPASKIFISFPVFTLKNCLYIANCQSRSAVICRHFIF